MVDAWLAVLRWVRRVRRHKPTFVGVQIPVDADADVALLTGRQATSLGGGAGGGGRRLQDAVADVVIGRQNPTERTPTFVGT